jgi:hypothetical protein
MPQATIQVHYDNEPKQAGWSRSIKTTDGVYYNYDEKKVGRRFVPGESVTVEYEVNAKGFINITRIVTPIPQTMAQTTAAAGTFKGMGGGSLPNSPPPPDMTHNDMKGLQMTRCAIAKSFIEAGYTILNEEVYRNAESWVQWCMRP